MPCTAIPDGLAMLVRDEFHRCTHGPPPHRIKVFIAKRLRYSSTYARLAKQADRAP